MDALEWLTDHQSDPEDDNDASNSINNEKGNNKEAIDTSFRIRILKCS